MEVQGHPPTALKELHDLGSWFCDGVGLGFFPNTKPTT